MTNLMKIEQNLTMTSLEIESLTGSRHDNVKRTIETLAKKSVISLPQTEGVKVHRERRTETVNAYVFVGEQGRRDSIIVVAQLCTEFTARIVDRWQELEAKEQKNQIVLPNFTDPAEAAMAWALQYKEKQIALQQLEIAKPKAEFVDKYVERDVAKNLTNVAKELGVSAKVLGAWLRDEGHAFKSTKKLVWTQPFVDKGYGVHKHFSTDSKAGSQALITPTGDCFIKQNFN